MHALIFATLKVPPELQLRSELAKQDEEEEEELVSLFLTLNVLMLKFKNCFSSLSEPAAESQINADFTRRTLNPDTAPSTRARAPLCVCVCRIISIHHQ